MTAAKIKMFIAKIGKDTKPKLPVSLRTNVGEIFYQQSKKTGQIKPLEKEPRLREWKHWALIENAFPYDAAFKTHHMLIPKRVVTKDRLNSNEKAELDRILDELSEHYDCHLVNFTSKQSLRHHHHIHLMVYKDERAELDLH